MSISNLMNSVLLPAMLWNSGTRGVAIYRDHRSAKEAFHNAVTVINNSEFAEHFTNRKIDLSIRSEAGGEIVFMSIQEPERLRGCQLEYVVLNECYTTEKIKEQSDVN